MRVSLLSVAILAVSLSSCCTPVVKYLPVKLFLPPTLQNTVTEEELVCLPDSTYSKIVELDKRRETLRQIIESTQGSN